MATEPISPATSEPQGVPTEHDHVKWFWDHYDGAAQQVIDFLAGDGLDLAGKQVCDIGCGDGIIDLGVFHKAKPAKIVGFDVRKPDRAALERLVGAVGLDKEIPDAESFALVESGQEDLPAPDDSFDFAFTWSAFEHVSKPIEMFSEIRRVLKPDGSLFLQLWPLYNSEHGGHLWLSYSQSFAHLLQDDDTIRETVRFRPGTDPTRSGGEDEYLSLNRVTIDDLQRAILAGGMAITKFELMTEAAHLPESLSHHPLSSLGISGVKLIAAPKHK
jgi:SAM-dependent methyltransferase